MEWSKEGATVESIEHQYLAGSLFPAPPVEEQESINQLIKERRTALISAAVTGKIDVRNWKSPEQNKTNKEDTA